MENINKMQGNKKSYKFDNFSNIIAENVDDLLYDKFYFNDEEQKRLKKRKKTSYKNLKDNNSEDTISISFTPKKHKKKYNLRNIYINKDIENQRYQKFIKNNRKILSYLKNKKRNILVNENNNEFINKNNICQSFVKNDDEMEKKKKLKNLEREKYNQNYKDELYESNIYKQFKKINATSLNRNNRSLYDKYNSSTFFNYNQENSKNINNSRDITINIYNKNKNYYLLNNINLYNYSEKRNKICKKYEFSSNLGLKSNYYKLNINNNYVYNINIKRKKKRKNKNINLYNLIKENNIDAENKNSHDSPLNYNYISFSYPKNQMDIKHYFSNYDYIEKHCRNALNCPICQSNLLKSSLKEKEMGIFQENLKDKKKKNFDRKKNIAKKYYIRNKEKYNKINKIIYSSKIQQYKKQYCFFNATKGIQKSNSSNEIKSLRYSQTNKNSYNRNNIASDTPIILYYFK